MARIIIHTRKAPIPVKDRRGVTVAAICMCGLSKKYPFCDGSHIKTRDEEEDKIYVYDDQGNQVAAIPREKMHQLLSTERPRTV